MKDRYFQALANPYRRKVINLLKRKSMSAGEIAEQFEIAQPSVSRHLDILKHAEIVTVERKGRQLIYTLNRLAMVEIYVYIKELCDLEEAPALPDYTED